MVSSTNEIEWRANDHELRGEFEGLSVEGHETNVVTSTARKHSVRRMILLVALPPLRILST